MDGSDENVLDHPIVQAVLDTFPLPRADQQDEYACDHELTFFSVRTYRDGSKRYGFQCGTCGRTVGKAVGSRTCVDVHGRSPEEARQFDETLIGQFFSERSKITQSRYAASREQKREEWRSAYHQYLRTDKWATIRKRALDRAGHVCEGCAIRAATEVHHKSYAHVGDEFLFELVALCRPCHARFHEKAE